MCYDNWEVNTMEHEHTDPISQEEPLVEAPVQTQEEAPYRPRPKWQVWAARIALVVFILILIMYYANIFRGGR